LFQSPALQGHLVGVITNGTAVLGLGNIGALAGKPVMEGKAVLFKKFADLDAFDLEVRLQIICMLVFCAS
jgi:malate dehydrogenase (oxaloacetate-decarboxylating)(NADP+)